MAHHQHDDYLCLYICVFLFCYTICLFWIYIYIPSVPRYLKIVKLIYIYIFKIQKNIDGGGF